MKLGTLLLEILEISAQFFLAGSACTTGTGYEKIMGLCCPEDRDFKKWGRSQSLKNQATDVYLGLNLEGSPLLRST